MAKRVYELARELGLESKEMLTRLQDLGIEVKTASSGVSEEDEAIYRMSLEDAAPAAATEPAAAETPAVAEPVVEAEPEPVAAAAPVVEEEPEPAAEEPAEPAADTPAAEPEPDERILIVEHGVTVERLARMMGERTGILVQKMMSMGEMVPATGPVPSHILEKLGTAMGYEILVEEAEVEDEVVADTRSLVSYEDDPASLVERPPVVTIMGHVDHGKTQLLDTIRRANVIAGEAGGITQHIGAYQVIHDGHPITFIDTPGHEAFTALRARGAVVTDIAIIVVAADDGVMPQTAEAISHAQAAEVPIIVAINKMDLPAADPTTVRANLTQHNIVVEELGGDVSSVEISALKGDGIDDLLELISLTAQVEELTANPKAAAIGTVIESQLEVGRGPTATVIVQRGTLSRGDALVAGAVSGRVRAMFDENGQPVKTAGPSAPVLLMGWDDVPSAGDMFEVVKNEKVARQMASDAADQIRSQELTVPTATERLEGLLEQLRTADHSELNVILRADAHGSLEAIRDAVVKIGREDAKVQIIQGTVGAITANDVMLAEASQAVIYGFNVRPDSAARRAAKDQGIDIRTFTIIYELLDDLESLLVGQLAPDEVESFLGVADVRATFRAPRYGTIAGSFVTEGEINRNARARLVRDGVVIYDGRIASLRRFKDDVATVATGFECGIGLENFRDIKEGDTIESYQVREVART
ncbi:MAG: translation initiation factor IF-2 [Acidimicrobiia bacterium]|nr:translation initiation factor IF-2 [Acidimicrobiia bacterium]